MSKRSPLLPIFLIVLVDILGFTVFTSADPVSELGEFLTAARTEPKPDLDALTLSETFDRFCVYTKSITLPDYQHGDLPFTNPGEGTWRRSGGKPLTLSTLTKAK